MQQQVTLEDALQLRALKRNVVARSNQFEFRSDEPGSATVSVRCECGSCRDWLDVEVAAYAGARRMKRFVTARGHFLPGFERVVLEKREFCVVEIVE
jgi:hypothetical protein